MEQIECELKNVVTWFCACVLDDDMNRTWHGVGCGHGKECVSLQKGEFALEICPKTSDNLNTLSGASNVDVGRGGGDSGPWKQSLSGE